MNNKIKEGKNKLPTQMLTEENILRLCEAKNH